MNRSEFLKWLGIVAAVSAAYGLVLGLVRQYAGDVELHDHSPLGFSIFRDTIFAVHAGLVLLIFVLALRYFADRAKRHPPAKAGAATWSGPKDSAHRRIAVTAFLLAFGFNIAWDIESIVTTVLAGQRPFGLDDWRHFHLAHVLDGIINAGDTIVSFVEWAAVSYLLYGLAFIAIRVAAGIRSARAAPAESTST